MSMTLDGLKRIISLLAVMCFLAPLGVDAAVPYEIRTTFESAGCQILKVEEVAKTDFDAQRVFVAWCSSTTVYLMVIKCQGYSCRIID
jgi:hypothetical protein